MGKGKVVFLLAMVVMLWGCASGGGSPMDEAIAFRSTLQSAGGCGFLAEITADYGNETYSFALACDTDSTGTLTFTVTAPESLAGISGAVDGESGRLTFDDTVLAFNALADGQLSPVAAPWTIAESWRTGYITSCGYDEERLTMAVDTTFAENPLSVETWLEQEKGVPLFSEICYNGQRILSVTISDFHFNNGTES